MLKKHVFGPSSLTSKKKKEEPLELILDDENEDLGFDVPPTILLYGDINDTLISLASEILIAEQYNPKPAEKIRILINSAGGELHSAFSLIELIESSKIPVETIALGQCVSAALLIFMSGTKGHRIVTRTCTAMSHTYSTDIGGTHWDLKEVQRELQNTQDRILSQYIKCTGLEKNKIVKHLIGKSDHWLKPHEVVEYGIADKIGPVSFE